MDFFAEAKENPEEFLSPGVTIDCNESLRLKPGDLIYTNRYQPMFKIVWDDVGEHDLLHPCCRPEMYDFFYQNGAGHPNCLEHINNSMGRKRPLIQPVNFFMYTRIDADGRIAVERPVSKPGDKNHIKRSNGCVYGNSRVQCIGEQMQWRELFANQNNNRGLI